jgi:AraC-like DNA-binding protein
MALCLDEDSLDGFAARFEAATLDRAAARWRLDQAVCGLARRLVADDGGSALHDVMKGFGISPRQLRRRFVVHTGLTPKMFSRLRRVRRACIDLVHHDRGQVSQVSAENGFADQPHFTREMKAVFDMSPQLVHAYLSQIRHINLGEDRG